MFITSLMMTPQANNMPEVLSLLYAGYCSGFAPELRAAENRSHTCYKRLSYDAGMSNISAPLTNYMNVQKALNYE
jgi:hypothetical protein